MVVWLTGSRHAGGPGNICTANMIYRDPNKDNNHNLTAPADTLLASAYNHCGLLGPDPEVTGQNNRAVCIGPKLVCITQKLTFDAGANDKYKGQNYTVTSRINSSKTGATYPFLDRDVPDWAPIWRAEAYSGLSEVFYVGHGMGRGTEIRAQGNLVGWNGADPRATRGAKGLLSLLQVKPIGGRP